MLRTVLGIAAVGFLFAVVTGAASAPPTGCCVITVSDSGDLFHITRGQRIQVNLSGSQPLPWSTPQAITRTLARLAATRRGNYVSAVFVARARGKGELRAVQMCRPNARPCASPNRVFLVHFVIS